MSQADEFARSLAVWLPARDMRELSRAAAGGRPGIVLLRAHTTSNRLRRALDEAEACLATCSPEYLAGALGAAAAVMESIRGAQSLDVVWTGPETPVRTSRLTAHTIVSHIDGAREEVWLVSYATYSEESIEAALQAAAERGVKITLLLERPADNPFYRNNQKPFPGLGATRLAWPADRRVARKSTLHAKILVVDTEIALVGSANISHPAMENNLECGILLRGGPHPRAIRDHLAALLEQGTLIRI